MAAWILTSTIDEANMSLAEVPRTLHCLNHRLPFHHHHRGARNHGSSNDRENHEIDEEEQEQVVWKRAARSAVDYSQDPHYRNHKGGKTGQQNKETKAGNFPHVFPANLETCQPRWPESCMNLRHSSNHGSLKGTRDENDESHEEKPEKERTEKESFYHKYQIELLYQCVNNTHDDSHENRKENQVSHLEARKSHDGLPFCTKDLQHLAIDLTNADGRVSKEEARIQHGEAIAWSMRR